MLILDTTEVVAGVGVPALEHEAREAHRQERDEQGHHQPVIPTHNELSIAGREVR